jgi:hypothetical protein
MHNLLKDYIQRFNWPENLKKPDKFYTQYRLDEYFQKLPYLHNIELFCLRLLEAKLNSENICIYSDYDTDAVTATATMYFGLIELGFDKSKLSYYVPDRFIEGYGMNLEAVIDLSSKYDLLVSVDCGINSVEEANYIKQIEHKKDKNQGKSCDLIITDHHQLQAELPGCTAVINPRLQNYYSEKQLYLEQTTESKRIFLDKLKNSLNEKELIKLNQWIRKTDDVLHFENLEYLSTSVTGVGVSWFCLNWLGYFLAEITSD